jgi:pantothenate synthetase
MDIIVVLHQLLHLEESPNIDFHFEVKILNVTTARAAKYLAQTSKGQKISEVKRRSMSKETFTDIIIDD